MKNFSYFEAANFFPKKTNNNNINESSIVRFTGNKLPIITQSKDGHNIGISINQRQSIHINQNKERI